MRIFTCSACQQMTFFENVQCTNCGHSLAYLPDHRVLSALERADGQTGDITPTTVFVALAPSAKSGRYRRLLANRRQPHRLALDRQDQFCQPFRRFRRVDRGDVAG